MNPMGLSACLLLDFIITDLFLYVEVLYAPPIFPRYGGGVIAVT